jgi:hypothetical protein
VDLLAFFLVWKPWNLLYNQSPLLPLSSCSGYSVWVTESEYENVTHQHSKVKIIDS